MALLQSNGDDLDGMRKRWSSSQGATRPDRPLTYLSVVAGLAVAGLAAIFAGNRAFAPEMYVEPAAHAIGRTLAQGRNHAAFDLNVNIREIRSAQVEQLRHAPTVALLGASHWQEAHADLAPGVDFLNAHVHRDYYEDLLAMSEVFVRNDKLPRTMVISVRDHLFAPIEARKDYLWLPGIANYRSMAARLGIETHSTWATLPTVRWREQISLPMLFGNAARWFNAAEKPGATDKRNFDTLDTLLTDGSILWSAQHHRTFTLERARTLALAAAAAQGPVAPAIDPRGVDAVDALFGYLTRQGVEVVIAFPPYNPVFFDAVQNTPYMRGLERVEDIARGFAEKYRLRMIGSFDPARVGCKADMYIDSEHSNPRCLARVLEQLGPVAQPQNPWVVSEAEQPVPAGDLAQQQRLILQNARAQIGGDRLAMAPVPEEARALGGIGESRDLEADTHVRGPAMPAKTQARAKSGRASRQAEVEDQNAEDQNNERSSEPRRTRRQKPAAANRQVARVKYWAVARELVWPGDSAVAAMTRRGNRLARYSQADR